jgi:hypothetical protein
MINGDDGVNDHTALNTHSMNDDAHDHDESSDDDVFAYERDPKNQRGWRRACESSSYIGYESLFISAIQ